MENLRGKTASFHVPLRAENICFLKLNQWFGAFQGRYGIISDKGGRKADGQPENRGLYQSPKKREEDDPKRACGSAACYRPGCLQVGRGLSAPDIALLEPLASVLEVTIVELLSGERIVPKVQTEELDAAARTVLDYSERQLEKTEKALAKKLLCVSFVSVCCWCLPFPH